MLRQTGHFNHRLDHAQRHHTGPGRRISRKNQSIECVGFNRHIKTHKSRADITRLADLQRDLTLIDDAREIGVGHSNRSAIDVERHIGLHVQQVIARNRR